LRGVAFQLVQRNFDRLAYIGAEKCEGIRKCAAVLKMSKRNQILWVVLCHCTQPSIVRECKVEDAGDGRKRNSLDNDGPLHIDHSNLGLWSRAMRCRVGIDVCSVDAAAVGRKRKVAGATPGKQALLFNTGSGIEYSHVV
jgi:hypothetical protein